MIDPSPGFLSRLLRQFIAFFGVGIVAAIVHYGALIGLVEGAGMAAIPATLAGYVLGGIVSYALNHAFTYESGRSHAEAGWRFAVVAGFGFLLTYWLMSWLHGHLGLHYLLAQILTTGIVLIWSFLAHKFWSFRDRA